MAAVAGLWGLLKESSGNGDVFGRATCTRMTALNRVSLINLWSLQQYCASNVCFFSLRWVTQHFIKTDLTKFAISSKKCIWVPSYNSSPAFPTHWNVLKSIDRCISPPQTYFPLGLILSNLLKQNSPVIPKIPIHSASDPCPSHPVPSVKSLYKECKENNQEIFK